MLIDRFILFLQNIDGIGDGSIRKLIVGNCFKNFNPKTLEDILKFIKSHKNYFSRKNIIDNLTLDDIKIANEKRKELEKKNEESGIKYISFFSEKYPYRFKKMTETKACDFPVIIYYKGDIGLLNTKNTCAIIGTRKPSLKALNVGFEISKKMTENGYVIISDLAEGCDTIAHKSCLDAGGKTIAIVGTGLDTVFPKSNKSLLDEILKKNGLVISEYPIGFKGASFSFAQRDRLQAACSDIVIPIQTSINGGTMHASRLCINEYGNKLLVINPSLVDDGDNEGNAYLINEFFARSIDNLNDIKL